MGELNVDKVILEINKKFENNDLVFWYDSDSEFNESIPEIKRGIDAQVYTVHHREEFKTKVYLEEHQGQKFLVYVPFVKPVIEKDFLTDLENYSGSFTADASILMLQELGLSNDKVQFVKKHFKFFNSKARAAAFKNCHDPRVVKHPELGIIGGILKVQQIQINEILIKLFAAGIENNPYFEELQKYSVEDFFWKMINQEFGYVSESHNVADLVKALYVNYTYSKMGEDFPKELENYEMGQKNNVLAFMSAFEDSNQAKEEFKNLTDITWNELGLQKYLRQVPIESLMKITFINDVDQIIIDQISNKVINDEQDAQFGGLSITQLCYFRTINSKYLSDEYCLLKTAVKLLSMNFVPYSSYTDAVKRYTDLEYEADSLYRHFVLLYSKVGDTDRFKSIKGKVERIYINNNLNKSVQSWNDVFSYDQIDPLHRQLNFYRNYVGPETNRIVVIVSDAFRFELAKELQSRLEGNDRIQTQMNYCFANLPSVTFMGMSSILLHKTVALSSDNKKLLLDGKRADTLEKRQHIIQERHPESAAYHLDELLTLTSTELKEKFVNQKIIYIFHNEVDSHGDSAKTENEVFKAGTVAINEIERLIESLRTISVAHIIVTADHGFIYREDKLSEFDKVELNVSKDTDKKLRYMITSEKIDEMGVARVPLATILGNDDDRYVYYPKSANVFKSVGPSNYVHGGSSLQEMLVPLLDIKAFSNKSKAEYVELKLGNSNKRVTGLSVPLLLIQTAPISDTVLPAAFKIYFVDETGHMISSKKTFIADSSDKNIGSEQQKVQLTIKSQKYDKSKKYKLVIENNNSGEKVFEDFIFDLTINNDFDFD